MSELINYLKIVSESVRNPKNVQNDLVYPCIEDFVLKNGMAMVKKKSLPEHVQIMEAKMCFRNAFQTAEKNWGWHYAEGYAFYAFSVIPTLHAWCTDEDGFVIDPTWKDGKEYYGVEFSLNFVRKTSLRKGTWGVIDDWENEFPLLRGEPWR